MQICIESNAVDIFLLWIWSCIIPLRWCFVFCLEIFSGAVRGHRTAALKIEFLFSVEVACDCED